jgi:hypothetical protein
VMVPTACTGFQGCHLAQWQHVIYRTLRRRWCCRQVGTLQPQVE